MAENLLAKLQSEQYTQRGAIRNAVEILLAALPDAQVAAVVINRMRKMPDPEHQLAAALRTFMAKNPFANPTGLASLVINFPGDGGRPSVGWQEWTPTPNQRRDMERNEADKRRLGHG